MKKKLCPPNKVEIQWRTKGNPKSGFPFPWSFFDFVLKSKAKEFVKQAPRQLPLFEFRIRP